MRRRCCDKCGGRLPGKKGHGWVVGRMLLCSRCLYPKWAATARKEAEGGE